MRECQETDRKENDFHISTIRTSNNMHFYASKQLWLKLNLHRVIMFVMQYPALIIVPAPFICTSLIKSIMWEDGITAMLHLTIVKEKVKDKNCKLSNTNF